MIFFNTSAACKTVQRGYSTEGMEETYVLVKRHFCSINSKVQAYVTYSHVQVTI